MMGPSRLPTHRRPAAATGSARRKGQARTRQAQKATTLVQGATRPALPSAPASASGRAWRSADRSMWAWGPPSAAAASAGAPTEEGRTAQAATGEAAGGPAAAAGSGEGGGPGAAAAAAEAAPRGSEP